MPFVTIPDRLTPTIDGPSGPVSAAICRLSRDGKRLAFWVSGNSPGALYIGDVEQAEAIGKTARRLWSGAAGEHVSELAWSADGQFLGMILSSGPPPGNLSVGIVRVSDGRFSRHAGHALAFAGSGATVLIADPPTSRVYMRDLDLEIENRVCEIADDGDPHFPPVISVSPDHRRFALVTRRVTDNATHVYLAEHDNRQWHANPLSDMPGTDARVLPFWSADSQAFAFYVIDLEQHHTAMIGVPQREGPGDILYTSDSIDAAITPAAHPDGRLIAFVRAHPKEEAGTLVENRLVLLDPATHTIATVTQDREIVGQLRWLDAQTLLVEGGPAIWTIRMRASAEAAAGAAEGPRAADAPAGESFIRTVVRDIEPSFTFACEVPADWQRVSLPAEPVDFADPRVMRPMCLFTPSYAAIVFTVATRPIVPGLSPEEALIFLARSQNLAIEPPRTMTLPCGEVVETIATQQSGTDVMKLRLVLLENGGNWFSLTTMAPAPLWSALRPTLDHVVESFALLDPDRRA